MSSAYSNSPHYSTLGLCFVGVSALHKSIIFPQACFPAVSFSRRRLCIRSLPNRTRTGTPVAQSERSVPGTCSDRTSEARRTSYRPGAPGCLPVSQLRHVVRLEFSGSFGPMQRGAEPRCRGAPNWIVHNTNHWRAVRSNMIPGNIRVPTLIVHAKWDSSRTMTLPLPGSERRQLKNISSDCMIALRRNSYGGDREEQNGVVPRADGSQVMPSHLALTL